MTKWMEGADFKTNIKKGADISKYLTSDEVDECLHYDYHLRYIDTIMARFCL
ncbi:adenylosuccinate lyase [Sporomusaceae bacterium BoRhaA]|uniref:hypothetical protein n=1 Tax=Pelorhabdus rhamnosifermentans TaxID=2772457 RepID=UPI001C060967|nr:hypothetical protein [Pelorhabdus rhamnosifermentans]MBU2700624.1 adenylosuccinate lyase [Pelorhabdus rhamnosifermentans]